MNHHLDRYYNGRLRTVKPKTKFIYGMPLHIWNEQQEIWRKNNNWKLRKVPRRITDIRKDFLRERSLLGKSRNQIKI